MPRGVKSTPKSTLAIHKGPKVMQTENDIFALDIGTRNVVGVIGHTDDGVFVVTDAVCMPHKRRAMLDGQIEDINETAKIVKLVKDELEQRNAITLTKVSIAAAGRALKTKRSLIETDIDGKDVINEEMLKSLELDAVSKAQEELDAETAGENISFYCVGHTVISYSLDNYQIKTLIGHKGKKASVDLIAAFLPSLVVESLYSVMDLNGLDVISLTLEPIAAMNVIIPPEVRLINIALVDIGAGTTDIAVSQHGSIVAYAMATTAGDEITEEIIQKYLVDFDTAEKMKLTAVGEQINFTDILGFEHSISSEEFFTSLYPAVELLADTISENIIAANGTPPAAVFLVGGGSLIPDLPQLVANRLSIPENRVAIGGQKYQKNVSVGKVKVIGPEYVTPIGIGITATLQTGYDFSIVTLNSNKIRIFDTKSLTVADLLLNAGYKTAQIIGKSGRGLAFTLNGEKQNLRGEPSIPANITVNGNPVSLEYHIKKSDIIEFTPATIGKNASVSISDIVGKVITGKVIVDGEEYRFGTTVRANDTIVTGDYCIQNFDNITIETIETLDDLVLSLPFDCSSLAFFKNERLIKPDYMLSENDAFTTRPKTKEQSELLPNHARDIAVLDEKASRTVSRLSEMSVADEVSSDAKKLSEPQKSGSDISVILNGKKTPLEAHSDGSDHQFLELMALADIDIANPSPSGNMLLTLNGKNASFMDTLHDNDEIIIRWDT